MGNCTTFTGKKKEEPEFIFPMTKFKVDIVKLVNLFQSSDIDVIDQKIQQVCCNESKKLLNFQLFLDLFPKLKRKEPTFGPFVLKQFYHMFDTQRDGFIYSTEIIFGLAIIWFIPSEKFGEVLLQVFGLLNNRNTIGFQEFTAFREKNKEFQLKHQSDEDAFRSLSKSFINDNNMPRSVSKSLKYIKETVVNVVNEECDVDSFCQYIKINYDIQKYRLLFDLFEIELQKEYLELIHNAQNPSYDQNIPQTKQLKQQASKKEQSSKKESIQKFISQKFVVINIVQKEPIYIVDMNWFNMWRQYLKKYDVVHIKFVIETGEGQKKQINFDLQENEVKDKMKLARPGKFQNFKLFGQYEGELKKKQNGNQLELFYDFVIFPKDIWLKLKKVYKGGPGIQRINLYFYPIFLYRAYTKNGVFIPQQLSTYIVCNKKSVAQIFGNQDLQGKLIYITTNSKNLKKGENENLVMQWKKIDKNFIFSLQQNEKAKFNHQFIVIVNIDEDEEFNENYIQNHEKISYGQYLYITSTKSRIETKNLSKKSQELILSTEEFDSGMETARVFQLRKNGVKVHYLNKAYYCDYVFSYKQIQLIKSTMKISTQQRFIPQINYAFPPLKKIENNYNDFNLSFMTSTIMCLIETPYFSDYLIKKKYKYKDNKTLNFSQTLINELSTLAIQRKLHSKPVETRRFFKLFVEKFPEFKIITKPYTPNDFIILLLNEIEKQIFKSLDRLNRLRNFKFVNNKDDQNDLINPVQIQRLQQDNSQKMQESSNSSDPQVKKNDESEWNYGKYIIKKFFSFEENFESSCQEPNCRTIFFKRATQYILNIDINEDEEVLFQGIFHPCMNEQDKQSSDEVVEKKKNRFGIAIKLSQKFRHMAEAFLRQIQSQYPRIIDLNSLHFTLQNSGEFRKHFEGEDFKCTLNFLNLKKDCKIMIYELREIKEEKVQEFQGKERINKKIYEYQKGEYVDYKGVSEWQVAQIIQYQGKSAVIRNYENQRPTKVDISRILPLKSKTSAKSPYKIQVIHRKQINKKIDRKINVNPFIISIAQLMSLIEIKKIITQEVKRYKIKNKQALKKKGHYQIDQLSQQDYREVTQQDYQVKFLKKITGDSCYYCNKRSRIYLSKKFTEEQGGENQQVDQNTDTEKYCYGWNCISANSQEIKNAPIGCFIDLKKLFVTIDWESEILEDPRLEHKSYRLAKEHIENGFNELEDCFKLMQRRQKRKFVCSKCKYTESLNRKYVSILPNILLICLKRFIKSPSGYQKLQNKIKLQREISLASITNPINNQDIFELYAIICHRGPTLQSGQWYSYVLKQRQFWVYCDESGNYFQDLSCIVANQIYMLFYRRKNIDAYLATLMN